MEGERVIPDLIAGIDAGGKGGIALLTHDGDVVGAYPMPETEFEVKELLAEFAPRISKAAIERLQPMFKTSKVTMFKLGRSYGFLRGILTVLQIPFDEIQPKAWQAGVGCIYPLKSKHPERKKINRQKAQQMFARAMTQWPINDQTADALLIAECLRRRG